MTQSFRDTANYSAQRYTRSVVLKSKTLTEKQKKVTTYLLNLWFRHYNGPKGYIHPSKNLICKKVGCSKITAQWCLRLLRDAGAIIPIGYSSKSGKRATRYVFDIIALMRACGHEPIEHLDGDLIRIFDGMSAPKNYPSDVVEINPQHGLEINPCISNAEEGPSKLELLFGNGAKS